MNRSDVEARVTAVLDHQAGALPTVERHWGDEPLPAPVPLADRRRRSWLAPAVAGVAAAAAVAAAVVVAGGGGADVATGDRAPSTPASASPADPAPGSPDPAPPRFQWTTNQVSFAAADVAITVDGTTVPVPETVDVDGDPGTWDEYTTLELEWPMAEGVPMRLSVYLHSDGREWWSDEIRTYDGRQPAEWITYRGDFFRSPLGEPFVGDVDVSADDHGVAGRLQLTDLRLEAFRRPAACTDPTAPYALLPGADRVTVAVGTQYGLALTLLDTATCAPVSDTDQLAFTWITSDASAVEVVDGDLVRVELRPLVAGESTVRVSATDHTGVVIAEADVVVVVTPPADDGATVPA